MQTELIATQFERIKSVETSLANGAHYADDPECHPAYPTLVAARQILEEEINRVLKGRPAPTEERYRHKKLGTCYTLIGVGRAQGALHDEDPVVLYRGDDGSLWVRHQVEFCDGRFEKLATATTPSRESVDREAAARLGRAWSAMMREFGHAFGDIDNGYYPEVTEMQEAVAALKTSTPETPADCTCVVAFGQNEECPLHGIGTAWRADNPEADHRANPAAIATPETQTVEPWPTVTEDDDRLARELVDLSFLPMTDEAYEVVARAIAVGRALSASPTEVADAPTPR